jgi:hypothetical protein
MSHPTARRRRMALALACLAALVAAGCGSGDAKDDSTTAASGTPPQRYAGVKAYLLDHTAPLAVRTNVLSQEADRYYALARAENFDYRALLAGHRAEVRRLVRSMQDTWRAANPLYEQAEGVVAGVPELADFDVILDAGAPASEDPENAVPFDLKRPDGKVEKRPGNFFFLTETALWGTEQQFVARGVRADLDGDGKVSYGDALPDANHLVAAARDFSKQTRDLDAAARRWQPTTSDVFTALVVMTPTMSEYFGAWKNSRFVAGGKATEASFVGTSRLSDITDILSGLEKVYAGVRPMVARTSAAQADQTGRSLTRLRAFAADLRDREADGERFTPEQADALGSEAQERAEAIAGQVSQAAAKLDVEVQD